jgi:hypothetical protein
VAPSPSPNWPDAESGRYEETLIIVSSRLELDPGCASATQAIPAAWTTTGDVRRDDSRSVGHPRRCGHDQAVEVAFGGGARVEITSGGTGLSANWTPPTTTERV